MNRAAANPNSLPCTQGRGQGERLIGERRCLPVRFSPQPSSLSTGETEAEPRRGFTLVELMVVILIMALLASAVALSFDGRLKAARARDAVEQLRTFDAMARLAAVRDGTGARIVFDLSANTLSRRQGRDADVLASQVSWPVGYWIEEVRQGSQTTGSGEASIVISPLGISSTYAVRLMGPNLDQWILFAGLTGAMTLPANEETVAALLAKQSRASQASLPQSLRHDLD